MKTPQYIFIVLAIVLLWLNTVTYLNTQDVIGTIQANTSLWESPEWMKYLEYCEWGFSTDLVWEGNEDCLSDYPGVFTQSIMIFVSIIITLISWVYAIVRRKK